MKKPEAGKTVKKPEKTTKKTATLTQNTRKQTQKTVQKAKIAKKPAAKPVQKKTAPKKASTATIKKTQTAKKPAAVPLKKTPASKKPAAAPLKKVSTPKNQPEKKIITETQAPIHTETTVIEPVIQKTGASQAPVDYVDSENTVKEQDSGLPRRPLIVFPK